MKIFKFKYFLNLLYQIWRFKYAEFIRGNHMLSGELPAKIWCHFIFSKHQTSSFSRSTSYFSMKLSPNYRKHIRSWCNLLSKLQKTFAESEFSYMCLFGQTKRSKMSIDNFQWNLYRIVGNYSHNKKSKDKWYPLGTRKLRKPQKTNFQRINAHNLSVANTAEAIKKIHYERIFSDKLV